MRSRHCSSSARLGSPASSRAAIWFSVRMDAGALWVGPNDWPREAADSARLEYGPMLKFQAVSDFVGPASADKFAGVGQVHHMIPGAAVPRRVLSLILQDGATATRRDVAIDDAVVAGWTGRDAAAVEKHIKELEALGVKRPASTPIFYRVSAARLTTDAEIEVVGDKSGGEVEFVLLRHDGRMWVGTG